MSDDDPFGRDETDDADGTGDRDEAGDLFADEPDEEVDDPFAELGEGVEGEPEPPDEREVDATPSDEREADATPSGEREADATSSAEAVGGDESPDPFAGLDADAGGSVGDGVEDPFESMDVGDVGDEDVWAALDEDAALGGPEADAGEPAFETDHEDPWGAPAGDERVVDKRSYCQQCPHFSAPPETACTHEGTTIVEAVDFSRFRVRDCPMVDADDPAFDEE